MPLAIVNTYFVFTRQPYPTIHICLHLMLCPEISYPEFFVFLLSSSKQINYVISTSYLLVS